MDTDPTQFDPCRDRDRAGRGHGTSNLVLRKWARRRGLLPEAEPGQPLTFTPEQVEAVRGAWSTRPADPTPQEADGWRVALANMAAERDTLRAELAVARVDAQDARRGAGEGWSKNSGRNRR